MGSDAIGSPIETIVSCATATIANVGPASAVNTSYFLQLPAGLTNVACTGGGIGCAYDPGTGAVVLSGLASPLASGQRIAFTLKYKASPTGTQLLMRFTVATSTPESNSTNSLARGTTI